MLYNKHKPIKLTVQNLQNAENTIIGSVQLKHFENEIKCITSANSIPPSSIIANLDPYVEDEGLLRVRGRILSSELNGELKNLIILPIIDYVTCTNNLEKTSI